MFHGREKICHLTFYIQCGIVLCTLPQLLPALDALFHGIRKVQVLAIPEFKKLILIFPLNLFVEIKTLDRLVLFLILMGFINNIPVPINC